MADKSATSSPAPKPSPGKKQARLSQSEVPAVSLQEALRVARAIADELAKLPSSPLQVAAAMGIKPTTGPFRVLTAASAAYGVTEGAAFAEKIGLTDLGRRIVAPLSEGDDQAALREALLTPRVVREFLTQYDGNKWPRDDNARNVLERMGVPMERTERSLALIRSDAEALGLLTNINGTDFVDLSRVPTRPEVSGGDPGPSEPVESATEQVSGEESEERPLPEAAAAPPSIHNENRRVFITHGKNQRIVEQIKKLLKFGDFEAVVSVDNQTVAKPVPDKVMDDMRSCSAAIVHVGSEMRVLDPEGNEHQMLNPNVLIEIGAAMALYDRRFILLVERGVSLPSNLQGLYEVRYEGDGLDYDSTTRLLEAFADFKSKAA